MKESQSSQQGKSSWEERAHQKQAALNSLIPEGWRLSEGCLENQRQPDDVRCIPKDCGVLSVSELEITEIDDIESVLERIRLRSWSSSEVVLAYCKRAAIAHQCTNCLSEILFDRALKRAAECDAHLEAKRTVIGPLHGLPISLKDQFDIAGVESTMGFASRIGYVSKESSAMVQLLESLGAIIFCRTSVPQTLLCDETINHISGRCLNPWNRLLTAGGSSGGEAALLAMKGSPIGVGTDLGGSIRKPATFCGLYSLRATSRRLPHHGASNLFAGSEALESVCGPMARSHNSIAYFMGVVTESNPWKLDAKIIPIAWNPPQFERACFAIMYSDGLVRCHPPLEQALQLVAEKLRRMGHEVVEWEPLDHSVAQDIVSRIFDSDGGEDVRSWIGDSGEPLLPQIFSSQYSAMSLHESWQLNKRRDQYRQYFLQKWLATQKRNSNSTQRPIDAIICANAPHLAEVHLEKPRDAGLISYTTVWSLLDLPCYTFPTGVVDPLLHPKPSGPYKAKSEVDKRNWDLYSPQRYENAPIGLQLICPLRFREDTLLHLAKFIEDAMHPQDRIDVVVK